MKAMRSTLAILLGFALSTSLSVAYANYCFSLYNKTNTAAIGNVYSNIQKQVVLSEQIQNTPSGGRSWCPIEPGKKNTFTINFNVGGKIITCYNDPYPSFGKNFTAFLSPIYLTLNQSNSDTYTCDASVSKNNYPSP